MTTITRQDFEQHHALGDCWIEIEGKVYDVSQWMRKHPGGERVLECLGGQDASLPFLLNHDPAIGKKYLKSMYIGDLEPKKTKGKYDDLTKDFKKLYHDLVKTGWFDTDYTYYGKKCLVQLGLFVGALYLFHLARYYNIWPLALIGSWMVGMFWQQFAFIGHDMGHNAVLPSLNVGSLIGLFVGNFLSGISVGWWKYTHNVHHVRTNDGEWDPDIQHMPMIAISEEYLRDIWSYFHRHKLPPTDRLSWFLGKISIKYQHYHWFFTIMSSRLFLFMSSIIFVFWQQPKHQNGKNEPFRGYNLLEMILLIIHHISCFSMFIYLTDHWFACYMVAYFTAGILHIQIILNHFPCPIFDGMEDDNFVVHQLASSMAIKSNEYTHWFYGGLQFQVEHHLFPMMPRHNLRKVKPYILALCKKYDLPYLENSFWGAIGDIFSILKSVAMRVDRLDDIHFEMQSH